MSSLLHKKLDKLLIKIIFMCIEELISTAHFNLTTKVGKKKYAPNVHELQEEIDKLLIKNQTR